MVGARGSQSSLSHAPQPIAVLERDPASRERGVGDLGVAVEGVCPHSEQVTIASRRSTPAGHEGRSGKSPLLRFSRGSRRNELPCRPGKNRRMMKGFGAHSMERWLAAADEQMRQRELLRRADRREATRLLYTLEDMSAQCEARMPRP